MSRLRLASKETKRLDLGEGDYLEVRTGLDKRTMRDIMKALPSDYDSDKGLTITQSDDFTAGLFDAFIVGWSLDAPVNRDSYFGLDVSAGRVVDEALANHFGSLTPNAEDKKSSEGSSGESGAGLQGEPEEAEA